MALCSVLGPSGDFGSVSVMFRSIRRGVMGDSAVRSGDDSASYAHRLMRRAFSTVS